MSTGACTVTIEDNVIVCCLLQLSAVGEMLLHWRRLNNATTLLICPNMAVVLSLSVAGLNVTLLPASE